MPADVCKIAFIERIDMTFKTELIQDRNNLP